MFEIVNIGDLVALEIRDALMIVQGHLLYSVAVIRKAKFAPHLLESLFPR
jgi:hypothetical protein